MLLICVEGTEYVVVVAEADKIVALGCDALTALGTVVGAAEDGPRRHSMTASWKALRSAASSRTSPLTYPC